MRQATDLNSFWHNWSTLTGTIDRQQGNSQFHPGNWDLIPKEFQVEFVVYDRLERRIDAKARATL
jgi:hypothetical protein